MALRSYATLHVQSTTVAQPLVGSWITAGIGAPSDVPLTLTLGTASQGSGPNDAEAIFSQGDPVWLLDPGTLIGEPAIITSVNTSNQVVLGPQNASPGGHNNPVTRLSHVSGAFGTGTWILLKQMVNNLFVQLEDGTGSTYVYIGNSPAMTATYRRVVKLAKVSSGQNPYNWSATENFGGNPFDISELWILGGANNSLDGYTPSFCVV